VTIHEKFSAAASKALAAIIVASSSAAGWAAEKSLEETTGLLDYAVGDPNEISFMKDWHLKIGGWINPSVTYNANGSNSGFNGPVTFTDRANELQLNQLYFFLQRAVGGDPESWDVGGRVDFMYGTDSIFTQAYGVPPYDLGDPGRRLNRGNWDLHLTSWDQRFYGIALPQAYAEIFAPVGNGLSVKLGHFYTPIGYEVVTAPDNFFISKPYTFQYGEPFTHTGALGSYTVDDNWSVLGGVVTGSATGGWDGNFNTQLGSWNGIGGATWTSDDKATSAFVSGSFGNQGETNSHTWSLYSIVLKHDLNEDLHFVVQHDHGFANQVFAGTRPTPEDAQWYGLNSYVFYDIQDNLSVGLRGEWFRDQDGFRVCGPARVSAGYNFNGAGNLVSYPAGPSQLGCVLNNGNSYYQFTAGVNWKPLKWLMIRPNVRYDWVDGTRVFSPVRDPDTGAAVGTKDSQFIFQTDLVLSF
jgi:hypothetical protein